MIDHTVIPETHSGKDDGKEDEAHELNGFAAPTVDEQEAHPISWDETRDGENDVSYADIIQVLVYSEGMTKLDSVLGGQGAETDCSQDNGGVEAETVKGDIESKP
jgi:hypothetical protein